MSKKKELKITLTYNTPSKEAMENFVEKSLQLYYKIIEAEKRSLN